MATADLLEPHADPVMASAPLRLRDGRGGRQQSGRLADARLGIHIGPVVAGVVGRSKFSFDLWGDTVNVGGAAVRARLGRRGLSER